MRGRYALLHNYFLYRQIYRDFYWWVVNISEVSGCENSKLCIKLLFNFRLCGRWGFHAGMLQIKDGKQWTACLQLIMYPAKKSLKMAWGPIRSS